MKLARSIPVVFLLIAIIALIVFWLQTQENLPDTVRLAAGREGGTFHRFATELKEVYEKQTGKKLVIITTSGAIENEVLLQNNETDIALLEMNGPAVSGVSAIAPIYDEVVWVGVSKMSGISTMEAMTTRPILCGEKGSGSWNEATRLLASWGVAPDSNQVIPAKFSELSLHPHAVGFIETTGLMNPTLKRLLEQGEFHLLSLPNAKALTLHYPHYSVVEIPKGFITAKPLIPEKNIETVAIKAFLASRTETSGVLVSTVLESLYAPELRYHFPALNTIEEARAWKLSHPWHSAAHAFYSPYEEINAFFSFAQGIDAFKELIVATCAGIYLLFNFIKRRREVAVQRELQFMKDKLDTFLKRTMEIEVQMLDQSSPEKLDLWLKELTRIKLQALEELRHEDLRGDRNFSIFLQQCGIVSDKIQRQLINAS